MSAMPLEPTLELKQTKRRIEATEVDLSGSTFTDVNFAGTSITDANLTGLRIVDANLTGASFDDCNTDRMTINGIAVSDVLITSALPLEPTLELKQTKRRIEATDVDLSGSIFTDVNFAGTSITDANLAGLRIVDANLTGASLNDCNTDQMTINGIAVSALLSAYRASRK